MLTQMLSQLEVIFQHPGPQPGFEVWWDKLILERKDFCSYYMFKTIFVGTTKFGGIQKIGGSTVPGCSPWPQV